MQPVFFPSPAAFRAWLRKHHATSAELWVGFWKKATGKPTLTWSESVDEALCYGWIDGVRRRVDDEAYCIRFTPRKPRSGWSAVNLAKMRVLRKAGRVAAAGERAYRASDLTKSGYSTRDFPASFDAPARARFTAKPKAWAFFQRQPPGYRRMATAWVTSAKKPETRERRLAALIADSAAGRRLGWMARAPGTGANVAKR